VEVVASLSQGRTAAAQCGFFKHKSVPVIFEPPYIHNHRYMGYMFRLYRVIFRPSKTTDPILQGSQVHCGSIGDPTVHLTTL